MNEYGSTDVRPGAGVVAFAGEIGADLVVVGSRETGALKRAPMGAVLVVREQESTNDRRREYKRSVRGTPG